MEETRRILNMMEEARRILNVTEGDSIEVIKRKYREQALRWHPDKNPAPNATDEFQKIQAAYECLSEGKGRGRGVGIESYRTMLFDFLRENIPDGMDSENLIYVLDIMLKGLKKKTEGWAITIFEKMGLDLFQRIYSILLSYRELLHLSDDFMEEVKVVLDKKMEKMGIEKIGMEKVGMVVDEIMIHPTIDDLFENKLYKLVRDGNTFLVPLWHHELLYDNSGAEFSVKCIPILPDGITIDENNNIVVEVEWQIDEIWDRTNLFIYIGCTTFYITRESLFLKENQIVKLYEHGISRINTRDVYDISKRGDIIIHIRLVL